MSSEPAPWGNVLLEVHGLDGRLGRRLLRVAHEAKATTPASITVLYDNLAHDERVKSRTHCMGRPRTASSI